MTKLDCRSGGGIILMDRGVFDTWRNHASDTLPDFAELLSIAVDPDGTTDQIFRWEGEAWDSVWKRETMPLVTYVNKGDLAIVVFRRGTYFCDLDLLDMPSDVTECITYEQNVYVPTGKLIVAELGKAAEDWEVDYLVEYDTFARTDVNVPKGWGIAKFIFPRKAETKETGNNRVLGTNEEPACIVRYLPSSAGQNAVAELPIYP